MPAPIPADRLTPPRDTVAGWAWWLLELLRSALHSTGTLFGNAAVVEVGSGPGQAPVLEAGGTLPDALVPGGFVAGATAVEVEPTTYHGATDGVVVADARLIGEIRGNEVVLSLLVERQALTPAPGGDPNPLPGE